MRLVKSMLMAGAICFLAACDKDNPPVEEVCIPSSLQANVIAFYPFADGSLTDASGNGHDLTNTTTAVPAPDRNGNPRCAFEFDNLPTSSEFLTTTQTSFLDQLQHFSISLWYAPADSTRQPGKFETLISRGAGGSCPDRNGQWSVSLYDCRKAVFGRSNSVWDLDLTNFDCAEEVRVRTGSWHHVVATYDGTLEEMKIYRDGNLQSTSTGVANCGVAPVIVQDIGDLFLGKDYTGRLDDIILFNITLNGTQAGTLFEQEGCCSE